MSLLNDLKDFFEEHKDVELSFQPDRNFTDHKKLSNYILDLEGAVRHFSGESLDVAMAKYRASSTMPTGGEKENE